jgi:ribulose-5-phosphate 4-epimerase/fuculose-1-phosphate aldolase
MVKSGVLSDSTDQDELAAKEREIRIQLAAGYRLADKFGLSEMIQTHISMRVPGPTPAFLLNPLGMLFSEVTASSLVKVDLDGNVVGDSEWPVNRAGVQIHRAIQAARPDANCVFHTHTPYCTAVASLECGLLPMSQAALRFYGDVAYHDYGRAGFDPTENDRLKRDLGDKWNMLLRNHGAITLGKTVGQAFMAAFYLERACQFQILAQSSGVPIVMPGEETYFAPRQVTDREDTAWPGLLRLLDREDTSYRD